MKKEIPEYRDLSSDTIACQRIIDKCFDSYKSHDPDGLYHRTLAQYNVGSYLVNANTTSHGTDSIQKSLRLWNQRHKGEAIGKDEFGEVVKLVYAVGGLGKIVENTHIYRNEAGIASVDFLYSDIPVTNETALERTQRTAQVLVDTSALSDDRKKRYSPLIQYLLELRSKSIEERFLHPFGELINNIDPVVDSLEATYMTKEYPGIIEEAKHDVLTGLYNRSFLEFYFDHERRKIDQHSSVLMIDMNEFKKINDTYGHNVGDTQLIRIAHVLKSFFRTGDIVIRYGGDEFVVILPNTVIAYLTKIIQRLKIEIGNINSENADMPSLDISIGMACQKKHENLKDTLNRADAAMYSEKNSIKARAIK